MFSSFYSRKSLLCLPLDKLPLAAVISDDLPGKIKQATKGFGSLDYSLTGYEEADLVLLEILVNSEPVDAFATVLARDDARNAGISILKRLKVFYYWLVLVC